MSKMAPDLWEQSGQMVATFENGPSFESAYEAIKETVTICNAYICEV